jgi:hypothetical protein
MPTEQILDNLVASAPAALANAPLAKTIRDMNGDEAVEAAGHHVLVGLLFDVNQMRGLAGVEKPATLKQVRFSFTTHLFFLSSLCPPTTTPTPTTTTTTCTTTTTTKTNSFVLACTRLQAWKAFATDVCIAGEGPMPSKSAKGKAPSFSRIQSALVELTVPSPLLTLTLTLTLSPQTYSLHLICTYMHISTDWNLRNQGDYPLLSSRWSNTTKAIRSTGAAGV